MSEDYGKDLVSVQNLQKKHDMMESDVLTHQDRMDGIIKTSTIFLECGHFDADNIKVKESVLLERYHAVKVKDYRLCIIVFYSFLYLHPM